MESSWDSRCPICPQKMRRNQLVQRVCDTSQHFLRAETMVSIGGQSHNRRRRRKPSESSLVVAAVGSLSVTLALALTTPFAPAHTHHDRHRGHQSVGPRDGWLRPRQQQWYVCCSSRQSLFSCEGPGLRPAGCRNMGRSRRRLRQHRQLAASLCLGVGLEVDVPADATGAGFFDTAGSAGRRPAWYLSASRPKEAVLVEPERLEGRDEDAAKTAAVQQQPPVAAAPARADGATPARAEEKPPVTRKRRPPAYWASDDNLRSEVVQFWADLGVTSNKVCDRCTRYLGFRQAPPRGRQLLPPPPEE